MGFKVKKAWVLAFAPALVLASNSVFASGGQVVLRTDNGADGYYYNLDGTGTSRYICEYFAGEFGINAIICGARWGELNQGTIPPPGIGGGDIRLEDPGNPGYPDIVGGLVATVDVASQGTCLAGPRFFTFGGGSGVPDPNATHYISAIQPISGGGPTDFCGTTLDVDITLGYSKYYSGGLFGPLPWNHFIEEIVFEPKILDMNFRASGSARFPGDRGIPVVFTTRTNTGVTVTDDNITVSIAIDNNTGGSIGRNLNIGADQSVIDPKKGLKDITGFFKPVGGGAGIMNPIILPTGRTVLKLEVSAAPVKSQAAGIVNKKVLNLPLVVLVDSPLADTDPMTIEGVCPGDPNVPPCSADGRDNAVDQASQNLGLRRRAGSADDNVMEAFFVVQSPNQVGDSLNVRYKAIDMPKVAYAVTGFEVVGGEFGGSGLPGLDAVELRTEDAVFAGSPDLTGFGLVRTFGSADGIGEAPLGPPPTTAVFNLLDQVIDPTINPGLVNNLYVLGLLLPGEAAVVTAVGADTAPGDTILGDSSFTTSGQQPNTYSLNNFALRALLNGDRSTLEPVANPATMKANANLREVNRMIAIDRQGNRIE